MGSRRKFIKNTGLGLAAMTVPTPLLFAKTHLSNTLKMSELKISLAQWSLHRALEKGDLKAIDFAIDAKESYGINAVEYVNQFYTAQAADESFWNHMARKAADHGVENLLMMVDEEIQLGDLDPRKRTESVKAHYKWIHAAKLLGCHSIRVNAFGKGSPDDLEASLVDGLGRLTEYAAKENIHVLLENHGLHTSNAHFMVGIIQQVDNPFLGTLPDFGNWCLNSEWGSTDPEKKCTNNFDPIEGLKIFLPYAKGVSAKSYAFDSEGNETQLNFFRLLKIVKNSEFNGHIGIEFEGEHLSEPEGIKATKKLIEKVWNSLK